MRKIYVYSHVRILSTLKCQYWPTEIVRYAALKIIGIWRKIYRITFYTFGTGVPCISRSDEKGTHHLGTINALIYRSFNFKPKVYCPLTARNFSLFSISFNFLLETTVKYKVSRYSDLGSCLDTDTGILGRKYDELDIFTNVCGVDKKNFFRSYILGIYQILQNTMLNYILTSKSDYFLSTKIHYYYILF